MVKIVYGDLLKSVKESAMIVHGCNAQGKMGSGFAKDIRNKYNGAYEAYMSTASYMRVGQCTFYRHRTGLIIANAITQKFYGNDGKCYVDYLGAEKALTKAAEVAKVEGVPVHFPFIGCGLAGGDKNKMLDIFNKVFSNVDATLWIKE